MLVLGALADPGSGEFGSPRAVWLAFVAFLLAEAIVFYIEFRFRRTRKPAVRDGGTLFL
jgi:hypothetical protein